MIIIQDTREKEPWDFTFLGCQQIVSKLDTGDYSIQGHENDFCIERKKTTGEIAINLGSKNETFQKEMERMSKFKKKYLICEFNIKTLLSFPALSGIPKDKLKYIRINRNYMISLLEKYELNYDINIIYCNDKNEANNVAYELMKEYYGKI